jgi:hypothetical protein
MLNEFSFLVNWTFSYDFGAISQEVYLKKNWFIGIDYNFLGMIWLEIFLCAIPIVFEIY